MAKDQLSIWTENWREGVSINYAAAVKLLDSAIKSLFLLNGAALVGLTTIIGLVEKIPSTFIIFWLGASFIAGVVCATIASLCGYASAMLCVQSLNNAMYVEAGSYVSVYYYQLMEPEPEDKKKRASDLTVRAVNCHYAGIAFGILSLVFFILGTIASLYVFGSSPLKTHAT